MRELGSRISVIASGHEYERAPHDAPEGTEALARALRQVARRPACACLLREGLAMSTHDHGAWTDWAGGACPVAPDTLVDVRLRSGRVTVARSASSWNWRGGTGLGTIIAYRVAVQLPFAGRADGASLLHDPARVASLETEIDAEREARRAEAARADRAEAEAARLREALARIASARPAFEGGSIAECRRIARDALHDRARQ